MKRSMLTATVIVMLITCFAALVWAEVPRKMKLSPNAKQLAN
jgi:hypothetical protein